MHKDYFSAQSADYKTFRPQYPQALFDFLCRDLNPHATVWDCATGNGQAALALQQYAAHVLATDQSAAQLKHAGPHPKVHYIRAFAEAIPVADHSIDMVTIAQALHWFDFDRFYAEVRRVVIPGGLIAAWTYSFLSVTDQLGNDIDSAIRWFYQDVIGPYWPPERRWVDEQYRTIPFPFDEQPSPEISFDVMWDLSAILGYMSSWSAVQQYTAATREDPMPMLAKRLTPLWGEPETKRPLHWSLALRVGTV
ncbi:MAG: ubiquinone/menaquinone biosynthesis C-methylase UbiE [Gammaproteobacteria bacterium]|jgi:ubiquinone/menaquinone biosynthesis C-methylase UbiE